MPDAPGAGWPYIVERVIDRAVGMRIIAATMRSIGRLSQGLRAGTADAGLSGWCMEPFETIYIDEMVAACNGGGGPLGHPRVYLNLAPAGRVECPYCSRLYVNRATAATNGEGESPVATGGPPSSARQGSATSG